MRGKIVEYIERQRIVTAICLEEKRDNLHLLTFLNKEVKLGKARIILVSKEAYTTENREQIIKRLNEAVEKRESLKRQIDILELWKLLSEDGGSYTIGELAEFYFPGKITSDQESAIFRALFEERVHFKLKGKKFEVLPEEYIKRLILQREKENERIRKIEEASNWLKAIYLGEEVEPPKEADEYINLLKDWYIFKEESPHVKLIKDILSKANLNTDDVFTILVKLGVFSKHENTLLPRYGIRVSFSNEVKLEASFLVKSKPNLDNRKDLTGLYTFTIDGPETKDFDDALSIEEKGDHYTVGIHITDLTPFILPDSKLDEEARERGAALYMPDGRIPLFPEEIPDELGSLKKGEIKPAVSFLIDLDNNSEILNYEIIPSLIRVDDRLTYDDADDLIKEDASFNRLYDLALKFRKRRLAQGGMVITLPELVILFLSQDTLEIKQRNPEQPSRILVAEFMIMTNYITACFLHEKGISALYRGQLPPRKKIMNGTCQDLLTVYLQRKLLNRSRLDTKPIFHHILGLEKYTAITSPLRRYLDLIIQRQLVYYLMEKRPLYEERELSILIPHLEERSRRNLTVYNQRLKYWLLTYLKQRVKDKIEAYILEEIPRGYQILLPEYLLETELIDKRPHFRQGDRVMVKIQEVDPKKELLRVVLG